MPSSKARLDPGLERLKNYATLEAFSKRREMSLLGLLPGL